MTLKHRIQKIYAVYRSKEFQDKWGFAISTIFAMLGVTLYKLLLK